VVAASDSESNSALYADGQHQFQRKRMSTYLGYRCCVLILNADARGGGKMKGEGVYSGEKGSDTGGGAVPVVQGLGVVI
jgi:hypothetical protein